MKLYKPTHHKPPFGRGYEGATPWGFTPANAPYEQSYITIDELGEAGQPLFRQIREGMMLSPPDADPGAAETRQRAEQRIDRWEATHTAAQQLAILYWNLHQERRATKASPRQGLPELTSA